MIMRISPLIALRLKVWLLSVLGLALALTMSGCAAPTRMYKLYPGPELPSEKLAILNLSDRVDQIRVDDITIRRGNYSSVALLPGTHKIEWEAEFLVSVMVNPSGWDKEEAAHIQDLLAGHSYTIHADRTTGPGYDIYLWLTDDATGHVIAGRPKP
jgi:hypothetical protein